MLPLSLSIEGLYSYQEKQTIDFTQLTDAGLFGIFGAVGSGKSSILEAISFALYGDTERLNKTDKRAYNMMNLKSNQTQIVFEFLNYENRKFRFVAQWKRRKNFEDTTPIERTAYEWKEEAWIPMESADGALITNLSYPNFRRTIIIPQGQFKEFLELKGKERSEMMKEIFFLNKFDLGPKVSHLQAANNRKLENLRGALSGFESISAEALEQKKLEVKEAKETLVQTRETYQELLDKVQQIQEFKDKQIELQQKQAQFAELQQSKDKIQQQEKELNKYEQTANAFREPLNNLQALNTERETLIHKIENLRATKDRQSHEIDVIDREIHAIQSDYLNLNNFRTQVEDYKLILQIKENERKIEESEVRLAKGTPFVERTKQAELELAAKSQQFEEELEKLKAQKIDSSQLIAMEKWYQQRENFQQQIQQVKQQAEQCKNDIATELKAFSQEGYHLDNFEDMISKELQLLENQLLQQREQETQLQVQAKLSTFANELQSGQACPLCGALDHPQPMVAEHIQEELQKSKDLRKNLEVSCTDFQTLRQRLSLNAHSLGTRKVQKERLTLDLQRLDSLMENHIQQFNWEGYSTEDPNAFEAQKQKLKQNEQQILDLEAQIKQTQSELSKTRENIQKYEKELEVIRNEISVFQGVNKQNQNNLQKFQFSEFVAQGLDEVKKAKLTLETSVVHIETTYLSLNQKVNTFRTKLAEVVGQYQSAIDQLSGFNLQLKTRKEQLTKLLQEFRFNDIIEVQQIIQRPLDVENIRQRIQQFYVRLEVLETQIAALKDFLVQKTYSEEELETTHALFNLKKEELELQLSLTGGLEKELNHLSVEFGKKEKLLEEFDALSNRGSNLKTMENLFKGNGFVNYVSGIHLRQMCEMANHRFHRLTRNQLSLTINESNEFEVIDYLNNGYRRSVKTLSGGQGFQASLCLALALAENIQSLNKADRNFFFIDEGFGTQDADSINTVFDTLQYLQQENRVVGIISHVEELKERIPSSVTVVKDLEDGSRINTMNS